METKAHHMTNQKTSLTLGEFLKQAIALFVGGGLVMTLIFGKYMGVHDFWSFIRIGSFQGLIWVILWGGNGFLSNLLDRKISWLKHPEKRFIFGVLSTVIYTIGSLSVYLWVWMILVNKIPVSKAYKIFDFGFLLTALLITALISMFLHSQSFLKEWRNSASEAERLRNENLSARYETLKNQVNPHFLFNSFNVLSSLVYKDQDMAAKFIKKMSNLYRYVLETKDKETVSLQEEVGALQSYSFLSNMRFGDNIEISIDLDEVLDYQVAPMTLQMLVENSIKHNIVSKAKPLKVEVFHEKGEIIVRNNLQRKSQVSGSAGIGLPNIQARYEYLSDNRVSILENNDYFTVKIPLLKL